MTAGDVTGVLTRTPGGVTVRFERAYPTSPEDLWASLTEPERVARWLGPLYGDLRVGGRYEVRMGDDVPDSAENATGEILACDPPRHLAVSWVFPTEVVTRVEVDVRPGDAGAVLVLRHVDLEDAAARGYGGGWHACLDQLGDLVAGRPVRGWQEAFDAAAPSYRDAV